MTKRTVTCSWCKTSVSYPLCITVDHPQHDGFYTLIITTTKDKT